MKKARISVLISVYESDHPDYLEEALQSIEDQSVAPQQIVIVKDGPVSKGLNEVISLYVSKSLIETEVIQLDKNVGLGEALNQGLQYCSYEWVMRMDSDDISRKNRIEVMLNEMRLDDFSHDVYGAFIEEFNQDNGEKYIRRVPLNHNEIFDEIGSRNPMNHVSVIINKQSLLDVDGYHSFIWFEDYFLWIRMILKGKKLINFPIVTVNVRIGNDMFKRRRGIKYLNQECKMQQFLLSKNLINFPLFIYNLIKRGSIRLLPVFLLKKLYKLERTSKR